jgi:hypothetical protein
MIGAFHLKRLVLLGLLVCGLAACRARINASSEHGKVARDDAELPDTDAGVTDEGGGVKDGGDGVEPFVKPKVSFKLADATTRVFETLLVGSETTLRIALTYEGNAALVFESLSDPSGTIRLAGGVFPGTGGTCEAAIIKSCEIVVVVDAGAKIQQRQLTATFKFSSAAGDVSVPVSVDVTSKFVWGNSNVGENPHVARGLVLPFGIWSDGVRLVVADRSGNRVLVWNTLPTAVTDTPDVVLGAPDLHLLGTVASGSPVAATNKNCGAPDGVTSDGTKIIVSCAAQNRVLVWNSWPTADGAPADVVIGQPDFTSTTSGTSSTTLWLPRGVHLANGNLFIADSTNRRVLIYDQVPSNNGAPADRVVGQPDFVTGTAAVSATKFHYPWDVVVFAGHLYVSDYNAHRILRFPFDAPATYPATGAAADLVIGHSAMNVGTANDGGGAVPAVDTLNNPSRMWATSNALFVADTTNHRVLRFSPAPTANKPAAVQVFGQPDFVTAAVDDGAVTAATLETPAAVVAFGDSVIVSDAGNSRLVVYDNTTPANGAAATLIWGQSDATNERALGFEESASQCEHAAIGRDDETFVLSCFYANRILVWNSGIPSSPSAAAARVIGQSTMTDTGPNANGAVSASTLRSARKPTLHGDAIWVADGGNNRVLRFDRVATGNFAPASLVVGQADFISSAANRGVAVAADTLSGPNQVAFAGTKMLIADSGNNRVLIFNNVPSASGVAANLVLGQPDMSSNGANRGNLSPSADSLKNPTSIWTDGTRLAVADHGNERILLWNSFPTVNGQAADLVLGQADFTTALVNFNGDFAVKANGIQSIADLDGEDGRLVAADRNNVRVLIWDTWPTSSGQAADRVLFQDDMTSRDRGLTPSRLADIIAADVYDGTVIVSDRGGFRLIGVPLGSPPQ